jgi:hypothetical protein
LVEITIPENVTTIWDNAFLDCSSLTEITIPANVTRIGFGVFSGNVLATVTCLAAVPPTLEAYNFGGTGDVLYVPAGSVDAYKADVMWNAAFAGNIVVIP